MIPTHHTAILFNSWLFIVCTKTNKSTRLWSQCFTNHNWFHQGKKQTSPRGGRCVWMGTEPNTSLHCQTSAALHQTQHTQVQLTNIISDWRLQHRVVITDLSDWLSRHWGRWLSLVSQSLSEWVSSCLISLVSTRPQLDIKLSSVRGGKKNTVLYYYYTVLILINNTVLCTLTIKASPSAM